MGALALRSSGAKTPCLVLILTLILGCSMGSEQAKQVELAQELDDTTDNAAVLGSEHARQMELAQEAATSDHRELLIAKECYRLRQLQIAGQPPPTDQHGRSLCGGGHGHVGWVAWPCVLVGWCVLPCLQ